MLKLVDRQVSETCSRKIGSVGSSPTLSTKNIGTRGGIGIRDSLRSYARKGVGVRVSPSAHFDSHGSLSAS